MGDQFRSLDSRSSKIIKSTLNLQEYFAYNAMHKRTAVLIRTELLDKKAEVFEK
jgi:hypothetical protein